MRGLKFCIFISFLMISHVVLAAPSFPELSGRVVDQAGLLSGDKKQNMIAKLEAFEVKSTAQIVVAVVSTLEGYEIRDYGIELARHWALGQADQNNGVLLLVAPNERKVSIEVGYGLEGSLTDALSYQIIQQYILPEFKAGNMGAGIEAGVDAILQGLAGEISEQSLMANDGVGGIPIETIIFFCFFFFVLTVIIVQAVRGGGHVDKDGHRTSTAPVWRHSSGRSSGGGGFSGGGGSFGGGGASGGW